MAGRKKDKFFCGAISDEQECPNGDCKAKNKVVNNPNACRLCGTALDYRCRVPLRQMEVCKHHRSTPTGPSAYFPWVDHRTPAEQVALNIPPDLRGLFAQYLKNVPMHEALHLLAARAAVRVEQSIRAGKGDDSVLPMIQAAGNLFERAARVKSATPVSEQVVTAQDAYDYDLLEDEEAEELERLLKKAQVKVG